MKHILLVVALLLGFKTHAQIGISPRILDVEQTELGNTHSFRLFNLSKQDYKVTVELSNWTMNDDNVAVVIPAEAMSLDQWSIINPLRFSIAAGSTQTIRLAFRPPADAPPGEYRTMVYFQQVLEDDQPEKKQLRALFKLGAAVYTHVGEKNKTGELLKVTSEPKRWLLETKNTGNSHIRYSGRWYLWSAQPNQQQLAKLDDLKADNKQRPAGLMAWDQLPTTPVLPEHTRNIPIDTSKLDDSIGRSGVLQLKGTLGDQPIDVFVPVQ